MSRDTELIDPTRDRVWAVEVDISYTAYVVAPTAGGAKQLAKDAADDFCPDYFAHELTEPLDPKRGDGTLVPYGASRHEDRELTVNEAVELIASHKPVYDHQTALMPFAATPPPLRPARIEDYLAAGRRA